jgi:hypothetical protein
MLGDPPLPLGGRFLWVFFGKKEKCLESPEMARKLVRQFVNFFDPPPRHLQRTISTSVDGGLSGGSSVRRPRSEDPHWR